MNITNNPNDKERPVFTDLYYSPTRHLTWLDKCESFGEVAEVAIDVLHHMHSLFPNESFIQICGPISTGGLTVDENLFRLQKAIIYQRELGRIVFNQLPTESRLGILLKRWEEQNFRQKNEYCFKLLEDFYGQIFKSGLLHRLCFLSNWRTSIGARWESEWGPKLGDLKIEEMPLGWEGSDTSAIITR